MSDAYTGTVTPGGEPQRRDLGAMSITKVAVDPEMSNNCYLLRCHETGDQVFIDAADDADRLLELIGSEGLTSVVTTHQHWDHHRALARIVTETGAQTIAGEPVEDVPGATVHDGEAGCCERPGDDGRYQRAPGEVLLEIGAAGPPGVADQEHGGEVGTRGDEERPDHERERIQPAADRIPRRIADRHPAACNRADHRPQEERREQRRDPEGGLCERTSTGASPTIFAKART